MQNFFAKPTPRKITEYIYSCVIMTHETGGTDFRYTIPPEFSISFINEVIERLGEYLLDVDVIELNNGYIVVDWS